MNFEIESSDIKDNINLVQTSKKLKTRPNDFKSIKKSAKTVLDEKPEVEEVNSYYQEPEVTTYESNDNYEKPETSIDIEDIIRRREEKEEQTTEVDTEENEPMNDNIEFAYAGRVVEPDVSAEDIDRIKSLGDDYKGEVHPRIEPIVNERKEPEHTEEDYLKLLKSDCYSPRTKKYLDTRYAEYEDILNQIENTQKEIEDITEKYKMESEIASKLTSIKKETYGIMTWINSSDFKILKNEKTSAVNNLFKSYEDLFNENQQKFKKADEELAKTNEISADLGKKEKDARENLANLTSRKKSVIEENYEKVEEVIRLDSNMKKQATEMTALTGIDEDDSSNGNNTFDSLRRDY